MNKSESISVPIKFSYSPDLMAFKQEWIEKAEESLVVVDRIQLEYRFDCRVRDFHIESEKRLAAGLDELDVVAFFNVDIPPVLQPYHALGLSPDKQMEFKKKWIEEVGTASGVTDHKELGNMFDGIMNEHIVELEKAATSKVDRMDIASSSMLKEIAAAAPNSDHNGFLGKRQKPKDICPTPEDTTVDTLGTPVDTSTDKEVTYESDTNILTYGGKTAGSIIFNIYDTQDPETRASMLVSPLDCDIYGHDENLETLPDALRRWVKTYGLSIPPAVGSSVMNDLKLTMKYGYISLLKHNIAKGIHMVVGPTIMCEEIGEVLRYRAHMTNKDHMVYVEHDIDNLFSVGNVSIEKELDEAMSHAQLKECEDPEHPLHKYKDVIKHMTDNAAKNRDNTPLPTATANEMKVLPNMPTDGHNFKSGGIILDSCGVTAEEGEREIGVESKSDTQSKCSPKDTYIRNICVIPRYAMFENIYSGPNFIHPKDAMSNYLSEGVSMDKELEYRSSNTCAPNTQVNPINRVYLESNAFDNQELVIRGDIPSFIFDNCGYLKDGENYTFLIDEKTNKNYLYSILRSLPKLQFIQEPIGPKLDKRIEYMAVVSKVLRKLVSAEMKKYYDEVVGAGIINESVLRTNILALENAHQFTVVDIVRGCNGIIVRLLQNSFYSSKKNTVYTISIINDIFGKGPSTLRIYRDRVYSSMETTKEDLVIDDRNGNHLYKTY